MKHWILLLAGCLTLAVNRPAAAQPGPGLEEALAAMKEVQAGYSQRPLSFDIKYTYSNEHTPDVVLDSLVGRMEISGTDTRCLLGNTETIRNEKYTIILFREDRIMYLAKSDTTGISADPLQMVRAVLEKAGIADCEVLHNKQTKIVRLNFKPGAPYRQMEMIIDTTSARLLRMRYLVKTALLTDNAGDDNTVKEQGYDEYAIVQAAFDHYREIPADPSRFNEQTFFYKEGKDFKVTQAYQDYKIFIGSPNL